MIVYELLITTATRARPNTNTEIHKCNSQGNTQPLKAYKLPGKSTALVRHWGENSKKMHRRQLAWDLLLDSSVNQADVFDMYEEFADTFLLKLEGDRLTITREDVWQWVRDWKEKLEREGVAA